MESEWNLNQVYILGDVYFFKKDCILPVGKEFLSYTKVSNFKKIPKIQDLVSCNFYFRCVNIGALVSEIY